MKKLISLTATGIVALILIILVVMNFNAKNKEVDLRNQISAKQTNLSNYYDKMWKILKQKAGVADKYKTAFKDIYTGLIVGRYSKGNEILKFVQESNPNFDASLYKDLMNSIEIERTGFYNEQRELIDLNREHENLLTMVPSAWFLSSAPHIKVKIVTSDKTEQVIESGHDNDIDL